MKAPSIPKLALIGAGSRGIYCYGKYIEEHPEHGRIVAVAEPRAFYREEAARRHQIPPENCFADWRELLAAPKTADAVIIATSDRDHVGPAIAAAKAGYHILLEKPMAPTAEECRKIVQAVHDSGVIMAVCHVLRYAPFFRRVKEIIASGVLGEITSIQQFEGVGWWHFAHSFVRGIFSKESESSFMLLAKTCHDVDLLRWWMDRPCRQTVSFGSLIHFRPDKAPAEATERCWDCPLADSGCAYSAKRFYRQMLQAGDFKWPLSVVIERPEEKLLENALRHGRYGRCVYRCDNDAVDTQTAMFEFAGGAVCTLTLSAFSALGRQVRVTGSKGCLEGNEEVIRILDFRTGQWSEETIDFVGKDLASGHGGGDEGLMAAFLAALRSGDQSLLTTGPDVSLESHLMVFAAEKSRLLGAIQTL